MDIETAGSWKKAAQQALAQLSKVWQNLLETLGRKQVMPNFATLCKLMQQYSVTPTGFEPVLQA